MPCGRFETRPIHHLLRPSLAPTAAPKPAPASAIAGTGWRDALLSDEYSLALATTTTRTADVRTDLSAVRVLPTWKAVQLYEICLDSVSQPKFFKINAYLLI